MENNKFKCDNHAIIPVMPVAIIATEHEGVVNFAPHGQIATLSHNPSVIYTGIIKTHKTAQNILAEGYFSVNIPQIGMEKLVLAAGSSSGAESDKSQLFDVFRAESGVPMVTSCPVNFVCKVIKTVEFGEFLAVFGEVTECFVDENCVHEGSADPGKVNPLLCCIGEDMWRRAVTLS